MTPPVYSVELVAVAGLAGTVLFTVPAGNIVILRDLDVTYFSGLTSAGCNLTGSQGQTIAHLGWASLESTSTKSWRGRQVIGPAEHFEVITDSALDVTLSGYLLTAP